VDNLPSSEPGKPVGLVGTLSPCAEARATNNKDRPDKYEMILNRFIWFILDLNLIRKQCAGDDADDDERQDDNHDTNNGIGDNLLGLLRGFFIAGGSNVTETADDEEQHRNQPGNCQSDIDDFHDKPGDRSVIRQAGISGAWGLELGQSHRSQRKHENKDNCQNLRDLEHGNLLEHIRNLFHSF